MRSTVSQQREGGKKILEHLVSQWAMNPVNKHLNTQRQTEEAAVSERGCGRTCWYVSVCAHAHADTHAKTRSGVFSVLQCVRLKWSLWLQRDRRDWQATGAEVLIVSRLPWDTYAHKPSHTHIYHIISFLTHNDLLICFSFAATLSLNYGDFSAAECKSSTTVLGAQPFDWLTEEVMHKYWPFLHFFVT